MRSFTCLVELIAAAPLTAAPPDDVLLAIGAGLPLEPPPGVPEIPDGLYGLDESGRLSVRRTPPNGREYLEPLSNFDAWILEERACDDGQEVRYQYAIQGRLDSGEILATTDIAAEEFRSLAWVPRRWGTRPLIFAGTSRQDHLRAAIQFRSAPLRRHVFTHTGWRRVDGAWRYLTASGAVGDPSVQVELGPNLDRFRLPGTPDRARQGMQQSMKNLRSLAPLRIMAPLHAAIFRAPLCSVLHAPLSLVIVGKTGIHKSSLAAVAMCHYGDFPDDSSFPPSWTSSANHMEDLAFRLKDVVCPFDDFVRSPIDAREMDSKASRVLRAQGNLSARGRLNADLSQREARPPRGLTLVTGETYPMGESLLARTFLVELASGVVKKDALTEAQRPAARALLSQALAGYVEWLQPQIDNGLAAQLHERFIELRTMAHADARQHMRVPQIIAHLALGLEQAFRYAVDIGAASSAEADDAWAEAWSALCDTGVAHGRMIDTRRPTRVFADLFQSLLLDRRLCLLGTYSATTEHKGGPTPVGWADATRVYILPGDGINQLYRALRDAGDAFAVPQDRLVRELVEDGIAEPDKAGNASKVVKVSGRAIRVYALRREVLSKFLGHPFLVPGIDQTDDGMSSVVDDDPDERKPGSAPF